METQRLTITTSGEQITIAVFADTHGRKALLLHCLQKTEADAVIHLGDHASDASDLDLPCFVVRGNCDVPGSYRSEMLLEIGDQRVFLTHGNTYGVKSNPRALLERAKSLGARLALYGHTHIADIYNDGTAIAANPGSLYEPRAHQRPSFGLLTYNGALDFNIVEYKRLLNE